MFYKFNINYTDMIPIIFSHFMLFIDILNCQSFLVHFWSMYELNVCVWVKNDYKFKRFFNQL